MLDLDGLSQLSYQDNLSYREDDHVSVDSRTTTESRGAGQHKGPRMESGFPDGLSQQATEGRLDMETAFTNQRFKVNDATDSSSAWSPEVWWIVIYYSRCKLLKDIAGQKNVRGEMKWKIDQHKIMVLLCACVRERNTPPYVFPFFLVF